MADMLPAGRIQHLEAIVRAVEAQRNEAMVKASMLMADNEELVEQVAQLSRSFGELQADGVAMAIELAAIRRHEAAMGSRMLAGAQQIRNGERDSGKINAAMDAAEADAPAIDAAMEAARGNRSEVTFPIDDMRLVPRRLDPAKPNGGTTEPVGEGKGGDPDADEEAIVRLGRALRGNEGSYEN